ncbi:MAG: divergent PAP2 family protein [Anaerolineaceae bacterium]|jgi:hypothetical protein
MKILLDLIANEVLISALISWFLGQFLKVPVEYFLTRKVNWGLWFSSGGMPSSHSSLMTAVSLSIGLTSGFDSPIFALSVATSMIVIYDATGVRRQAGIHAQKINMIIEELLSGKPLNQEQLKEVLGHTPREVAAGVLLGVIVSLIVFGLWN